MINGHISPAKKLKTRTYERAASGSVALFLGSHQNFEWGEIGGRGLKEKKMQSPRYDCRPGGGGGNV